MVVLEQEGKLQLDWTTWKIAGEPIGDYNSIVLLPRSEWLDRVLVFSFRLSFRRRHACLYRSGFFTA
ncbi:MAG: hypothetical protein DME32_02155 [Verrucomicrobia bacterium]|nr:MAG: hypothetical protein DME32_02155 [Verrucomicrobiota bacterium]